LAPDLANAVRRQRNRTKETAMTTTPHEATQASYGKCIATSKRVRWDIDADVLRGREFDYDLRFLPDGLSRVDSLEFLDADARRFLTQVQGRTYANTFGLVERFIGAKILEVSRDHALGDQVALEALLRFGDEELKHQELFRRLDAQLAAGMPAGYRFLAEPNAVAGVVLAKSTWAVLALTCHIEIFTQVHYRESIASAHAIDPLFKDVFRFHWLEEAQHAVLDELEWERENARLTPAERSRAVGELIELVAAIDGILQAQAAADVDYFVAHAGRGLSAEQIAQVRAGTLAAYRWQYIVSGVQQQRFSDRLGGMISEGDAARIGEALAPLLH
jgi:hypothetical protein